MSAVQQPRLDHMTLKMLDDHLAGLKRARDDMRAGDARRSELDQQIAATEAEIGRRPPRRPTGLESLAVEQILNHFVALAKSEDDEDDEMEYGEMIDALYWKLDNVRDELERREGNPRALVALYTHPDIRVRHRAAEFTQTFAPALARSRLLAIDDDNWVPPRDPEREPPVLPKLARMETEELVERFLDIALKADDALLRSEIPKFNRLYGQREAVELALKARDGDQRRALLPLLDHRSAEVRLRTAYAVVDFAPDAARQAFLILSDRDEYPQAADARGKLEMMGVDWYKARHG